MISAISASVQFEGDVWKKPAFKTLETFLTDSFHCNQGVTLCESDTRSWISPLEEDGLCRYSKDEIDLLLNVSELYVLIDIVETEEPGDAETHTYYTITCNDENAALDLKVLEGTCRHNFIYFLDNTGPYDNTARALAYGAAVAKDTTGLLKRYLKEEYDVEFAEARFRTFVNSGKR